MTTVEASNNKLVPKLSSLYISWRIFPCTGNNYYAGLPEAVLSLDKSIRYCAIVDRLGYITAQKYRQHLQPVMTAEESRRYALQATIRQSTRSTWDTKLGKSLYSCTRYEHLVRVAIPLADNHLLLLSCDAETKNIDSLVRNKIIPKLESFHSQGANYAS